MKGLPAFKKQPGRGLHTGAHPRSFAATDSRFRPSPLVPAGNTLCPPVAQIRRIAKHLMRFARRGGKLPCGFTDRNDAFFDLFGSDFVGLRQAERNGGDRDEMNTCCNIVRVG